MNIKFAQLLNTLMWKD